MFTCRTPRGGSRVGWERDPASMRIALVTETFFPAVDGTTTTLKAVADGLVDAGHEVLIVAPAPGLSSYRGSVVVRVQPLDPVGAQVRSGLEDFRPDVIHVTSPGTVGRKALKWARRNDVPTVVVEQSPVLDLTADYWRAKVADRADRLLVTSRWMQERVAEFGVDAELWTPGVDTAAFTPALRDQWLHDRWARKHSADGERVVVGYVGSLHKRHGVRRLAELASMPGIRPVVIGDGPQRGWLESRLPGSQAHRRAPDRRPDRRTADPRRAGPPRRARDLLPRAARGRGQRRTGCRAARRRSARRRSSPGDRAALRPGRPEGRSGEPSSRSSPTATAPCWASAPASCPRAPGPTRSASWP